MYLWVLLATFMVALLSFNISVRPDADRQYTEAKAQTIITKFRVQHNAFKDYIASKRLTVYRLSEGETTVDYRSGVTYNGGDISGPTNANLNGDDVKSYLPFGFEPDSETFSKVYCFVDNDTNEANNYPTTCENDSAIQTSPDTCCAEEGVAVYVVSWRKIPSRWVARGGDDDKPERPVSDMLSVISKAEGYGYSFGYITTPENSNEAVISGGMYESQVPVTDSEGNQTGEYTYEFSYKPIFQVLKNDDDFKQICMINGAIKQPCLIAVNRVINREDVRDD